MTSVFQSQGPTLRIGPDRTSMRHATWLELFFDLVFVVAVAELAQGLGDDLSFDGLLHFSVLFLPVWWSWIGATYYSNRFDSDSTLQRVLTFGQMAAAAAMAVNVHGGARRDRARLRTLLRRVSLHSPRSVRAVVGGDPRYSTPHPTLRDRLRHRCIPMAGFGVDPATLALRPLHHRRAG